MKKVIFESCGDAEKLKVADVKEVVLRGTKKVKVKVLFSSLNAVDWKYRTGHFRFFTKLFNSQLGYDLVGEIVEVSPNEKKYKEGDVVLGLLPTLKGGAQSEFVILETSQFIVIEKGSDYKTLAGLPMAGITAWISLIEKAKLREGQAILINGGSSGVGHIAIQLAKYLGAEVTTMSSAKNLEFCKNMGADYTIDYNKTQICNLTKKYDVFFDVVSNTSIKNVKHILKPKGVFVDTNISISLIKDIALHSNVKFVYVYPYRKALEELYELVILKKIEVKIDEIFDMDDIVNAHKYMEKSRTVGKVIIKI